MRVKAVLLGIGGALSLSACATAPPPSLTPRLAASGTRVRAYNRPYQVRGRWYAPADQPGYDQVGLASWYSYESRSRTTADGEPFDVRLPTAAHTTLPIPSWLEVTNLDNGRRLRVRLNDRGPFVSGRILDVSRNAAEQLGFLQRGTARVRVQYLGPAAPTGLTPPVWVRSEPATPVARRTAAPQTMARAEVAPPTSPSAEVAEDLAASPADEFAPPPPPPYRQAAMAEAIDVEPSPHDRPVRPDGVFVVQVGAFADRGNAERVAERLSSTGETSIRPLEREGAPVLYRVLVGAWPQAEAAASARSQIVSLGFVDATVLGP